MCQLFFDEKSIYEISKLLLNFCNGRTNKWTDGQAQIIWPFNLLKAGGITKVTRYFKTIKI